MPQITLLGFFILWGKMTIYRLNRREIQTALLYRPAKELVKNNPFISITEKVGFLLGVSSKHVRATKYTALRKLGFPKIRRVGERKNCDNDYNELCCRVEQDYNLHNLSIDEILNLDLSSTGIYQRKYNKKGE